MKPLMLSVDDAAKALSIGKTKLYSELSAGHITGVKLGKRTLITRESIDDYIATLKLYPMQNSNRAK